MGLRLFNIACSREITWVGSLIFEGYIQHVVLNFLLDIIGIIAYRSRVHETNTWCFEIINDALEFREISTAVLRQHFDVTMHSLT